MTLFVLSLGVNADVIMSTLDLTLNTVGHLIAGHFQYLSHQMTIQCFVCASPTGSWYTMIGPLSSLPLYGS